MSRMSRKDAENQVRSWGFSHVFTWTDSPDYHYNPHKHSGVTTHLILSGELTISYPEDNPDENLKETLGPGARFDVPAGKMHEVWVGKEGCTYVIGSMRISTGQSGLPTGNPCRSHRRTLLTLEASHRDSANDS